MQGAEKRQPGQAWRRDQQARELRASVMREWEAAGTALRRIRSGPLTPRAIDEVALAGIRLAASDRMLQAHIAAMLCQERQDELERRAEEADAAAGAVARLRALPRRRTLPMPAERPLRSVPLVALLLGCLSAAWQAMKAHAARTVTAGLLTVAGAGTMTSFIVLTPHSTQAATVPQKTIPVPAAASPAARPSASVPVLAVNGQRKHRNTAVPAPSRHPRRKPHPRPSASPSPSVMPGTLLVSPLQPGIGGTRTITLTAEDGPVEWLAVTSGAVTLVRHGGILAAGESVTLVIRAPGPGSVTFSPGDDVVRVQP